jgi:phenylacetate-coenzyme A ligase PaaK-like adenylate-forming protein
VSRYEHLRRRHQEEAGRLVPEHVARLSWPAERLKRERRDGLRALLADAAARSPWHRRRLAGIDPRDVDEDDLRGLPTMTKADLMTNFDEIVTDARLTRRRVEAHLAAATDDDYLLDRYHAVASGGSSGERGVFVYDWDAWAVSYLAFYRHLVAMPAGRRARSPLVMAVVAAGHPTHFSSTLTRTFSDARALAMHRFPVTLPLERIVEGLNAVRPTILNGYPSALHLLAGAARRGTLRIAPDVVLSSSEPLLPETRAALEEVFPATVLNCWGTSEAGPSAVSCGAGAGMHVNDDLLLIEPVDAHGRPVPAGTPAAKLYLTNLFNRAQPLIRYELTDEVTVLRDPCPCGSAHSRVADIQGRQDDLFHYGGGVIVHPHIFRSRLARERGVVEYQVRQTPRGADVLLRIEEPVNTETIRRGLVADLSALGLAGPRVAVDEVALLERQDTGKLRRFVPLAGGRRHAAAPVARGSPMG